MYKHVVFLSNNKVDSVYLSIASDTNEIIVREIYKYIQKLYNIGIDATVNSIDEITTKGLYLVKQSDNLYEFYNWTYGTIFAKLGEFHILTVQNIIPENLEYLTELWKIFEFMCKYNKLNIAKLLFEQCEEKDDNYKIMILMNLRDLICDACVKNHLELAKWFYDINNKYGNLIDLNDEEILTKTCESKNNNLEVVKWLVEIGTKTNINHNELFITSCKSNNHLIAEYIYNLGSVPISSVRRMYDEIIIMPNKSSFSDIGKFLKKIISSDEEKAFSLFD